jgi:hypothetical protein
VKFFSPKKNPSRSKLGNKKFFVTWHGDSLEKKRNRKVLFSCTKQNQQHTPTHSAPHARHTRRTMCEHQTQHQPQPHLKEEVVSDVDTRVAHLRKQRGRKFYNDAIVIIAWRARDADASVTVGRLEELWSVHLQAFLAKEQHHCHDRCLEMFHTDLLEFVECSSGGGPFSHPNSTLLMEAVFIGADERGEALVNALLHLGADPNNAKGFHGTTPIFHAPTARVASLLIDHGARVRDVKDSNGATPLDYARRRGHASVAQVLESTI